MARPYDIITFDCYGTLVDWNAGIVGALSQLAGEARPTPDEVLDAYHRVEPRVQAAEYRPYRDVLGAVARRCAEEMSWALAPGRERALAESVPDWTPFPDTNAALQRLREAGYRLGILSNIDDDLLEATRRHFSVEFDLIVTAQQVRSYKPAAAHFDRAQEAIGTGRWLHAAQSWYHDIVPASARGIASVWVNRLSESGGADAHPTAVVPDMTGLADWLEGQ